MMMRLKLTLFVGIFATAFLALNLLITGVDASSMGTQVGGPIISNTTWTQSNSPYIVIANIDVWQGVTLTIEPGVEVRFNSTTQVEVNGELIARGSPGNPIKFTSNQSSPQPGDWGGIEFTSTAVKTTVETNGTYAVGSVLQHCVVEYGGDNIDGAVILRGMLIDNCTVRLNDATGIYAIDEGHANWITNNKVLLNYSYLDGGGIWAENATIDDNTIENNIAKYDGGGIHADKCTVSNNKINNNKNETSRFGGGIFAQNDSMILSNTVANNQQGGAIYVFDSSVTGNVVNGNVGYYGGITAFGSWVEISDNVSINNIAGSEGHTGFGGGIFAQGKYGPIRVHNNTVANNRLVGDNGYGGGIYCQYCLITNNTVANNVINTWRFGFGAGISSGMGHLGVDEYEITANLVYGNRIELLADWADKHISAEGGGMLINVYQGKIMHVTDNTVSANKIIANAPTVSGSGVLFGGAGTGFFDHNTVVGNTGPTGIVNGGLDINGNVEVHFNNLYGNSPYDLTIQSSEDISGTNNYWGTVADVNILDQVYDWFDDASRGKLLYIPYLQNPSVDAPFPPPTGLTAVFDGDSAQLSWNEVPSFTTGWGYKVYYDTDSYLPPFEGKGLIQGNSPIDVGAKTNFTLNGLDSAEAYFIAVTVYDNQGRESWYSNWATRPGNFWQYTPLVLRLN